MEFKKGSFYYFETKTSSGKWYKSVVKRMDNRTWKPIKTFINECGWYTENHNGIINRSESLLTKIFEIDKNKLPFIKDMSFNEFQNNYPEYFI